VESIKNTAFNLSIPERFLVCMIAMISPPMLFNAMGLAGKVDLFTAYPFLVIVMTLGYFYLRQGMSNPLVPCLSLQMVLFMIFFDKKFIRLAGLETKMYLLAFGAAALLACFYLVKHFRYLWNTYQVFRCFLIFFIISACFLGLGHYSEFRLNTDLFSLNYLNATKPGAVLSSQNSREFGAFAQYVLHIEALIPIVAVTVSLMTSHFLAQESTPLKTLRWYIKIFTLFLITHFSLSVVAYLTGRSPSIASLGGDVDPGSNFLIPVFLCMLISFKYYIYLAPPQTDSKAIDKLINICLILVGVVVANTMNMSGSTSLLLALMAGLGILFPLYAWMKFPLPFFQKANESTGVDALQAKRLLGFYKFLVVLMVIIALGAFFYSRIGETTESDASSMNMRISHWKDVYQSWSTGLNPMTLLFGFGIDRVREVVYYASTSSAVEKGIQSPHNLYISSFFDYGLCSLVFFVGFFDVAFNSIQSILNPKSNQNVRIFSVTALSVVALQALMWVSLDPTLIVKITIFSCLGFLEALKQFFKVYQPDSSPETVLVTPPSAG
jgi:O-Antigen ligase